MATAEELIAELLGRDAASATLAWLDSDPSGRLATFATLCDEAMARATDMSRVAVASELHESCRLASAVRRLPRTGPAPDIVIAGLPRSGTTALQRLLGTSSAARTTIGWQVATSRFEDLARGDSPNRARAADEVDARYRAVVSVSPRLAELHPLGAYELEECTPLYRATARHFPWAFLLPAKEIEDFLVDDFGERFPHDEWLAALGTLPSDRSLVVKSPLHTGYLAAIRAACPHARVVVTRRQSDAIVRSFASLVHAARSPFVDRCSLPDSGAQALRILHRMASAFRAAVDQGVEVEVIDAVDMDRSPRRILERLGLPSDSVAPTGSWARETMQPSSEHPDLRDFEIGREDVVALASLVPELCA